MPTEVPTGPRGFVPGFQKTNAKTPPSVHMSSGRSTCPSTSHTPCSPIPPHLHAEAEGEPFLHKTSNCKYFLKMYKT